jgi:hypothetical protein
VLVKRLNHFFVHSGALVGLISFHLEFVIALGLDGITGKTFYFLALGYVYGTTGNELCHFTLCHAFGAVIAETALLMLPGCCGLQLPGLFCVFAVAEHGL